MKNHPLSTAHSSSSAAIRGRLSASSKPLRTRPKSAAGSPKESSTEVEEFAVDFRTGGTERTRYRFKPGTPIAGAVLTNEALFQDIVPNRRIVTASTMALGDRRISASLVTVEFLPSDKGTDLICTHQGAFFEGSDGPQMREAGWRKLFERLERELAR